MNRNKNLVELYKSLIDKADLVAVPGNWYLFEQEGRLPRTHVIGEDGILEGCGPAATSERMAEWGWVVTPILIFRKSADENNQS